MARILVAEDDPAAQSFLVHALGRAGHAVTAVDDGVQALEALRGASFDLVLTDIVMPGLDGIGLALNLARDQPTLPVVLMTGYATEMQRAHNLEEIVVRVVSKPFTLEQICAEAEAALTRPPRREGTQPAKVQAT